jgi:hypothetical protein
LGNINTDNDILQLLKNDVNKGFRVIVEKYSPKLYWHIRRLVILHKDADDAQAVTYDDMPAVSSQDIIDYLVLDNLDPNEIYEIL